MATAQDRPSQKEKVAITGKLASLLMADPVGAVDNWGELSGRVANVRSSYTIRLSSVDEGSTNVIARLYLLLDESGSRRIILQNEFGEKRGWLIDEDLEVPRSLSSDEINQLIATRGLSGHFDVIVE
ncbi:MAG: hypothetical protein GVY12_08220 [Bacteroidetes bacterium]|nr:hypothetical protein [Bacteroidota bacterium]